MLIAQVTLHAELVYGRAQVHVHLLLLGIVAHAHGDVRMAAVAPDIVGHLEADDEYALVELARSLAQRVRAMIVVQILVLLRIKVRRVVLVLSFPLTLSRKQMKIRILNSLFRAMT